jgi:hypothetical protein
MHPRKQRQQPSLPATNRPASRAWLPLFSLPLALGLSSRDALADCAGPEPAIVWSYPAQGDTGVPTNVDLWVLPAGWNGPPIVSRDGVALGALRMGYGYDAGELEPNTTYTFHVELETYGEIAPTIDLTFTTGAGPAAADPVAAPGDIVPSSSVERALSERCNAALATQDCFDQGQDTYYQFTPSGSAKGWVLMTDSSYRPLNVWPGECGAPTLFGSAFDGPCATLYGIDATGQLHAGQHVCAEASTPLPDRSTGNPEDSPPAPAMTPPAREPVNPPDGEPTAANDTPERETSRGSATHPVQSSSGGGCSLPRAHTERALDAALALALSLAALARRRRSAAAAR